METSFVPTLLLKFIHHFFSLPFATCSLSILFSHFPPPNQFQQRSFIWLLSWPLCSGRFFLSSVDLKSSHLILFSDSFGLSNLPAMAISSFSKLRSLLPSWLCCLGALPSYLNTSLLPTDISLFHHQGWTLLMARISVFCSPSLACLSLCSIFLSNLISTFSISKSPSLHVAFLSLPDLHNPMPHQILMHICQSPHLL